MSRGRPGKIHTNLMAGRGGLPDRDQVNDAIADALSDWLDPDDDEGIDLLAQIDGLMTDDVLAAFASYHAEAEAASLRISASDEQKDLDAIRKDAVYLLEHDDPKRRILFMHRMQMFPPFAFGDIVKNKQGYEGDAAFWVKAYDERNDQWTQVQTVTLPALQKQVQELSARPTKAELEAITSQLKASADKVAELEKQVKENPDTVLLDQSGGWLKQLWARLFGGK